METSLTWLAVFMRMKIASRLQSTPPFSDSQKFGPKIKVCGAKSNLKGIQFFFWNPHKSVKNLFVIRNLNRNTENCEFLFIGFLLLVFWIQTWADFGAPNNILLREWGSKRALNLHLHCTSNQWPVITAWVSARRRSWRVSPHTLVRCSWCLWQRAPVITWPVCILQPVTC